ncbi:hypothetical protein [Flammeovirga sp. OC4]|uniref:hypothetical protein n=1 Tax=Flammeovirga sp. OC4 TaxID=1382345 RepID=UPI0005C5C993|nr:hypothetical protein [Flammeovirga sp. OC4]
MSKDDKIASLEEENTSLSEENVELKERLNKLQSLLYGSKSEKRKQTDIPENQLSIFVEKKG